MDYLSGGVMHRKLIYLLCLTLILLVAGIALAHEDHNNLDNMCGHGNYGLCHTQSEWERGWYNFLCHNNDPRCARNSRQTSYQTADDESSLTIHEHRSRATQASNDDGTCHAYRAHGVQRCLDSSTWICVHYYAGINYHHEEDRLISVGDCFNGD